MISPLIDDRWLVDPWLRLVLGEAGPIAYDLEDPEQARVVAETYGPRSLWKEIHDAVDLRKESPQSVFVQCSEENYAFLSSQGGSVSVFDAPRGGAYAWLMPSVLETLSHLSADFTVWPVGGDLEDSSDSVEDDLPGMWSRADLVGGWTDCCERGML